MSKNDKERHPGGDGGGSEERPDDSGGDISRSEKDGLKTLYYITASVGAAAGVVFVIYKMSGENWETTCWCIAGIVALVAGVWVITKMPRRLLKHICYWIAGIAALAATGWIVFLMSRWLSKATCYWIAGIVVLAATVWGISKMSGRISKAVKRVMDKTVERTARWVLVAACALVLTLVVAREAPGLVAVVDCVHWKAPDAVATGLTTIDVRDWCSMYTISLRTDSPIGVRNPTLKLPDACYIEVKKDNVKKIHQDQEVVSLPSLPSGEQIDIKAWATCKADRPNAERVRITHLGGRPARLDVRKPARALAQWVNQHVYIAWGCIGVAVYAVLAVVTKGLFGWLHRRKPAGTISQYS